MECLFFGGNVFKGEFVDIDVWVIVNVEYGGFVIVVFV